MSSSDQDTGRPLRRPLIIGAVVLAVSVILLVLLWGRGDGAAPTSSTTHERPSGPAPLPIAQAPWRVSAFPAGNLKHLRRPDKRLIRDQRPRLARFVRGLYDALFLERGAARAIVRNRFTPAAARSFVASRHLGAPPDAADVKTLARRATIGIQAPGARRAVALVRVRARGRVGARRWRVTHESTLWLERAGRGWRVIAFDVEQRPVHA
jgi:hypothetical protein